MAIMDSGVSNGGSQNNANPSSIGVLKFGMNAGALILLVIILIIIAQYGSKKIALSVAALIFLSSLIFNIEKIKEVFRQ